MDYSCKKPLSPSASVFLFFFILCFFSYIQSNAENHTVISGFMIAKTISISSFTNTEKEGNNNPSSVTIPLRRIGRLFLIEAKIDNEVGNFVFDSGSSKLVLNRTYFRKYMIINGDEGGGVTGATNGTGWVKVRKLQISDLTFENTMADVTDLGHIENRRGVKILGLFGLSLIKNLEMEIDLNHNELHLFRLDKNGKRIDGINNVNCPHE